MCPLIDHGQQPMKMNTEVTLLYILFRYQRGGDCLLILLPSEEKDMLKVRAIGKYEIK